MKLKLRNLSSKLCFKKGSKLKFSGTSCSGIPDSVAYL